MKKYYCDKCNIYHHRGKIFKDHYEFRRKKTKNQSYGGEELEINLDDLRPIAKRQLHRLLRKAKKSNNRELYKNEIIKLIESEKRR
ncbi:MAG: hypothetical protein ACFFD7_15470 [Candidatus Thorarchaeota archaeon]